MLWFGSKNLHLVAALQFVAQGHQLVVDFSSDAMAAQECMDGECKIQCRTVLRHRFDFTFRSEDKYFRSEQVQFDGIQKVHGIRLRIIQNFLDGTQPFSSSPSSSLPPPSLYFQCAAKPCSATSFIRSLRICTSIHWPLLLIRVTWSADSRWL